MDEGVLGYILVIIAVWLSGALFVVYKTLSIYKVDVSISSLGLGFMLLIQSVFIGF